MKQQRLGPLVEASTKFNLPPVNLPFDLPLLELIVQTKAEIEALSAQAGLKIIQRFLEKEITQRGGPDRQQVAFRHVHQSGCVTNAGRKVVIPKPRIVSFHRQRMQTLLHDQPDLTLPALRQPQA